MEFVKEIASKEKNFPQWYVDVVRKAELADYTSIKGCMVIRPYGYGRLYGNQALRIWAMGEYASRLRQKN